METDKDKIQWIYGHLCDEESKYIFENRRKYAKNGDRKYIDNIVRSIPEYASNVYYSGKEKLLYDKLKDCHKKLVLFGFGYRAQKIYKDLCAEHIDTAYIVDSDVKKQGTFVGKIPIVSLRDVVTQENVEQLMFLITSSYHAGEIRQELLKYNCRHIENANEYIKCFRQEQYFEYNGIFAFEDQEIFVDGGCFDLETTRIFRDILKKEGKQCMKVYAFEPDRYNYLICKGKIESNGWHDVNLVNAGLWHEETYAELENVGTAGAHIIESEGKETGQIKTVSLDCAVDGKDKITFIKLDIEGAELEALQGARRILLENKPKLAVCLYHKKEDYWQIPYYLKTLVPEYRLYIRHYSNYSAETVLYAVSGSCDGA